MINEKRILRTTSIIPVLSIIIFSIVSIAGFYYTTSNNNKNEISLIKKEYLKYQKRVIKDEVNTVYKFIQFKIDKLSHKISKKELQNIIMNDISNMRFGDNGYFYIYNYDGVNLMHPIKPHLTGKNLYNLKDKNGVLLIQELIKASQRGGGYVDFMWDKPSTNKLTKKLGYAIGIDKWKWMIGTGIYMDDVDKVVKEKELELDANSFNILQNFIITSIFIIVIMSFILIKLMGRIQIIFLEYNNKLINYQKNLEKDVQTKTKQIQDKNSELNYKIYHDNLTDILNRVSLQEYIKNNNDQVALAILDIKEFSKLNNIYGEYAGDEILKVFARVLVKLFKDENFVVYRISGDKFAILNQNITATAKGCKDTIKTKLAFLLDKPLEVVVDEQVLDVVLQYIVGIAQGVSSQKLIEQADMALNYAKKQHKQIVIYSKELHIEDVYKEDMRITQIVKNAIIQDRVVPFFQAIVKTDETSYECLVRIKNEDGTIISPNLFLPVIKQTEYYSKITKIMIEKSFKYFQNSGISFSINLSFEDISNKSTRQYISEKINQYNVSSQLILEILESESIDNFDIVRKFITDMRSLGVKIAIDDFGSGYSNFAYLLELKPDFVKIDGSLIKDMHIDKDAYIMVKNIARFLQEMDLKIIAEYVHNKEIYDITKELNFDGLQGYFLAKPLPDIKGIKNN